MEVVGVEAGVVVAIVAVGEIPCAADSDAAAVGSGSFTVVRMNSGEPRYHAIVTRRRAETIAATRMPAGRGMQQVSLRQNSSPGDLPTAPKPTPPDLKPRDSCGAAIGWTKAWGLVVETETVGFSS